jgi:hypothetical protein
MVLIDLASKQHSQIKEYEYKYNQVEIIQQLIEERKERELLFNK